MAIVKFGGGGGLERRVGIKAAKKAAKKGAKHAIEKHAAKKHPAKKHADKHAGKKSASKRGPHERSAAIDQQSEAANDLSRAFHSLQRASALISLLEPDSGGDLRDVLSLGVDVYRTGRQTGRKDSARCATGLLQAAENLALAGLYLARAEHRVDVEAPTSEESHKYVDKLSARLQRLVELRSDQARRYFALAQELLRRATSADGSDPHLQYELTMAADGLCTALEQGL